MSLQKICDDLLREARASRVTLRQTNVELGVTHESLAPGVESLREVRSVDLPRQPVVAEIRQGRQVVQDDTRNTFVDNPEFQEMLEIYGGMGAQIVTPIVVDGAVVGALSLHHLGDARHWSAEEIALCDRAAEQIAEQLG
jgi:GAF domain-containing protein